MNRPILIITIGYMIGIIWGLYFKISIVFFYLIIILIYFIITKKRKIKNKFKIFSIHRYFRYIKLVLKIQIILLIIISSLISNLIVKYKNEKHDKLYSHLKNIEIEGIIVSNKEEEQYYNRYQVKVIKGKYKNTKLYIKTKHKTELDYGDRVIIKGKFIEPQGQRNYKGFDYKKYLKSKNIYGTIKVEQVEVKEKNYRNKIKILSNKVFIAIKTKIEESYNIAISPLMLGIMLGYTENIDENLKKEFSESSISHILAVSGMHISYIIVISKKISKKIIGKKNSYIISSIILIIYMYITGFSTSVVRAGIMGIITCMAFVLYRKSDVINNIALSALIILINNPFTLFSTSFLLTYGGTIGIIMFSSTIEKIFKDIKIKNRRWKYVFIKIQKKSEPVLKIISVTIAAQIVIAPIMLLKFNSTGIAFLITNLLLSCIIGIVVMGAFVQILLSFLSISLGKIFAKIIEIPTYSIILIAKIGKYIPFGNFKTSTPSLYQIIIYYIILYISKHIYLLFHSKKLNITQIRFKNIIHTIKYKLKPYSAKLKYIIVIIFIIIYILSKIPQDLKIYFVDVGQGDCTLIITPHNKTILIDGGGSTNYNVGENILIPYLYDRKIKKIDYIIVSHFDQDHVRTDCLM